MRCGVTHDDLSWQARSMLKGGIIQHRRRHGKGKLDRAPEGDCFHQGFPKQEFGNFRDTVTR
jgi:hypothetical protein